MSPRRHVVPAVAALAALTIAAIAPAGSVRPAAAHAAHAAHAAPAPGTIENARAREVSRIRSHFDSVLVELRSRDVASLPPAQRDRRAALLATLRAYRDRGEFPHNYDFPGESVPYFVDRGTGTLCAVAHLLESTGRRDIVDRVARTNNNVRVAELAGDSALARWLATNGLTLSEAARIQVPYVGDPAPIVQPADAGVSSSYRTGAAIAIGGAAAASLWNAFANSDGHRRMGNLVGMTAGAAAIGLGAAGFGGRGAAPALGTASVVAGGLSAFLSTRGFLRHRSFVAAERAASRDRLAARTSLSPLIPVGSSKGAGVAVRIEF